MPGIGLLGLVAPQNAQLVAGKDPSGLLRALTLDSAGRLITTTADGAATVTGPASTAALALSGARWASVYFTLNGASGTMTQQYSVDGGVNWLTGPYVKRIDVVSANPAVTATITTASGTYEMPLPGNTTNVRLSGASGGTVTIAGGLPYVTGVPVTATLAEVTSVNVAYDSGTLELAGWSNVLVEGTAFTPAVLLITSIHSDGTGTAALISTSTSGQFQMLGAAPSAASQGTGVASMKPIRGRVQYANAGASTSYVHIMAYR